MPAHPLVVLIVLLFVGGYVFYFLNRHGLIRLLWLAAWVLGGVGMGGLLFDRGGVVFASGVVPAVLLLCGLVAMIGAGVLEYLKRLDEKAGPR